MTLRKMDSKKKNSEIVKDVNERKQVVTRLITGRVECINLDDGKGGRSANPAWRTGPQVKKLIDIPFKVGRIVCDSIVWHGTIESLSSTYTQITSDLFGGETLGSFGDAYTLFVAGTMDITSGITQTFSNAEVVFSEPKKIRNSYSFAMMDNDDNEEQNRQGDIAILLKFYEY